MSSREDDENPDLPVRRSDTTIKVWWALRILFGLALGIIAVSWMSENGVTFASLTDFLFGPFCLWVSLVIIMDGAFWIAAKGRSQIPRSDRLHRPLMVWRSVRLAGLPIGFVAISVIVWIEGDPIFAAIPLILAVLTVFSDAVVSEKLRRRFIFISRLRKIPWELVLTLTLGTVLVACGIWLLDGVDDNIVLEVIYYMSILTGVLAAPSGLRYYRTPGKPRSKVGRLLIRFYARPVRLILVGFTGISMTAFFAILLVGAEVIVRVEDQWALIVALLVLLFSAFLLVAWGVGLLIVDIFRALKKRNISQS